MRKLRLLGQLLFVTAVSIIVLSCSGDSNSPTSSVPQRQGKALLVPSEYGTIAAACDSAGVNDTVLVACGEYVEHDILLPAGAFLMSETGLAACAVINADSAGRCLRVSDGDYTSIIKGIYFRNGLTPSGDYPNIVGGGVLSLGKASLVLQHCYFENNTAAAGGGLYWHNNNSSATLSVENCTFSGNHSVDMGYASMGGNVYFNGPAEFTDCFIFGGSAGDGGGIYGLGTTCSLTQCRFSDNTSDYRGGGMYFSGANLTGDSCTWESNVAGMSIDSGGGGGLWIYGIATLTGSSFSSNSGYGRGAGLRADFAVIHGCIFEHNDISSNPTNLPAFGGAIFCVDGGEIVSSTLAGNYAGSGLGSGIYCSNYPGTSIALNVAQSAIVNGTVGTAVYCADGVPLLVGCTDIWGNTDGDWVGRIASQAGMSGNFSADPAFSFGTLRPGPTSPLLPANNGCDVLIGALSAQ